MEELGSRAWGFSSPESDFDVRFIYVHRPEFYLRLQGHRDVMEEPVDDTWDVGSWDLDKTLRLLWKSSLTLFEWFNSPIVNRKTDFCQRFQPLLEEYFSIKSELYHYLNTARHHIKDFLQGETVRPKKCFYALRPILACRWVLEQKSPPSVLFSAPVDAKLPARLLPSVDHLLDLKMHGPEKLEIPPIREINREYGGVCRCYDAVAGGVVPGLDAAESILPGRSQSMTFAGCTWKKPTQPLVPWGCAGFFCLDLYASPQDQSASSTGFRL